MPEVISSIVAVSALAPNYDPWPIAVFHIPGANPEPKG